LGERKEGDLTQSSLRKRAEFAKKKRLLEARSLGKPREKRRPRKAAATKA